MKIIDLLNKIANGEKVPKKIAIQNEVLIYNEDEILNLQDCYYVADEEDTTWKIWAYELNDEVEILDEKDKDIPLIPDDELYTFHGDNKELNYNFKVLKDHINELAKELNEYRKGDK